MNEKILITSRSFRKTEGPHQDLLRDAGYQIVESPHDRPLAADELAEAIAGVVAAILGVDEASATVFEHAERLKVVSRFGVGIDQVDLDAATRHGVVVTNTPGANSVSVAELAIGLMLALARHIPRHNQIVKRGSWQRIQGIELSGATLGLIGMGHIGREVATRAFALGMKILYHDPVQPPQELVDRLGASSHTLEELLSRSDVVSLHAPHTDATHNLIDAQALDHMKSSAMLVNTARGGLVDEEALYEALVRGKLAGAACDVFSEEPPRESPLLELDNFVATPHAGSATLQATIRMGTMAAQNALAVLRGERPAHVVNPAVYERHGG